MAVRSLVLESFARATHQLSFVFRLGDARFHTSYWYDTVDLRRLESDYGAGEMEWVYAHIAAFEINKFASLMPAELDLGPLAGWHTVALEKLWRTVFHGVWAQWRYENDQPDYQGPVFASSPQRQGPGPIKGRRTGRYLAGCGGGKDSLASARLLDRAGVAYDSLGYSHSVYGPAAKQHALIEGLLAHTGARRHHRVWMTDDFLDAPVLALGGATEISSLCAAETPSSLFASVPILLAHGLDALVVGHERSADVGNLVWDATGEDVNHQWAKSTDAERLLAEYLHTEVLASAGFFSTLKPVNDVVIFELLRSDLEAVPATHSCNSDKPWCRRCAKCAYVWLGYVAHLPRTLVDGMFGEDLTAVAANDIWFRQMLGLADHTPFECVGQIDEARLALHLALASGPLSDRAHSLAAESGPLDIDDVVVRYCGVDAAYDRMPPDVAGGVLPQLRAAADRARDRITATLVLSSQRGRS